MSPPSEISVIDNNGVKIIFKKIRYMCLTFAILMLLSVSVHPAMAEMDVKDRIEKTNAAIGQFQATGSGCPGCAAGLFNGTFGDSFDLNQLNLSHINTSALNVTNFSFSVREIPMGGRPGDRTIDGAENVTLPFGTLEIQPEGYRDNPVVSASMSAAGSSGEVRSLAAYEGKIADFDRDPSVQDYIRNVTTVFGYTSRTDAYVKRIDARILSGVKSETTGLYDVATYTYANLTTHNRYRFMAVQSITPSGVPNAPMAVFPGIVMSPVGTSDPDGACWYWYLLIGLAALLVIAAIIASIAIAAAQAAYGGYIYYKKPPLKQMKIYGIPESQAQWAQWKDNWLEFVHAPDGQFWWTDGGKTDVIEQPAPGSTAFFARTVLYTLFLFLLLMMLISPPLVTAALTLLLLMILGLAVCTGMVKDQNDQITLEDRLNLNNWVSVTEKDNGRPVLVSSKGGGLVFISLDEGLVDGVPYVWNSTSDDPDFLTDEMPLSYPDNPDKRVRVWTAVPPANQTRVFYARYVPVNATAGPALKEFRVGIVPIVWGGTDVDTSSQWVGYGSSLAVDPKTDGMHIAYLDYSGTYFNAGKVMYRYGEGVHWDSAAVVDDSIDWTARDGTELARRTSVALDMEGNPWISYMDWKNGHLKVAHRLTRNDKEYYVPGGGVPKRDRFKTETVDAYSDYTGWGSSIAVDRQGNPHISYLRQSSKYYAPQLMYAHRTAAGWDIRQLDNAVGKGAEDYRWRNPNVQDGAYTSIALDSQDRPHISYVDFNRDSDKKKSHTCTTIASGRHPFVQCNPNLQLMHIAWNGTGWTKEAVDPDLWGDLKNSFVDQIAFTWHGLYNSIAMDVHDQPHISYMSAYADPCFTLGGYQVPVPTCHHPVGDLKYASWDGSKWGTEIVDNSSDSVGLYTSMKIDSNDRTHISYMDWKNGFLRYATRPRSGSWTRGIPDRQSSDTGRFTSLGLDHNGNPRIVYMDYTNGHVKYVYGDFGNWTPPAPIPEPTQTLPATTSPTLKGTPVPTGAETPAPTLPAVPPEKVEKIELLPVPGLEPPVPSGSDGNAASISPGTTAGTAVTYSFDNSPSSIAVSVNTVSLVPDREIPESRCTVRKESPLPDFQLHGGPALYEKIEVSWINPTAITDAKIGFSVTKSWLDENHVAPADVVLMRQHDLKWAGLPTTFDRQEGDRYYYTAATPGFSYFAVTDKTTALLATAVTAVPTARAVTNPHVQESAVTPMVTSVSVKAASGPVQLAPVAAETVAPVPVPPEPVPGLPLLWIAVAALISMLGVAGFFIGRRLWWQHQNPNLFRKYD
jgi:PGF-pre-PGF domain-containing protein